MKDDLVNHILYVDDDVDDLEFFRYVLKDIHPEIQITTTTNSINLLTTLQNMEMPDVVILDMNMPLCDGIDCLIQLKNSDTFSHIPVVLYSTSKLPSAVIKSKEYGASHFIKKGSSTGEVLNFIKQLCNGTLEPLELNS